jgi:hypothetical protein
VAEWEVRKALAGHSDKASIVNAGEQFLVLIFMPQRSSKSKPHFLLKIPCEIVFGKCVPV